MKYQELFNAINDIGPNPTYDQMDHIISIACQLATSTIWVWIDMKDELPPNGKEVFAYFPLRGKAIDAVVVKDGAVLGTVSHWMHRPNDPNNK